MIFDALAEPRNIESEGRILISVARPKLLRRRRRAPRAAIRHTETAGGLRSVPLPLRRHGRTPLEIAARARASPAGVRDRVPNIETADVEQLSIQISQACPLLEIVKLPCNGSAGRGATTTGPLRPQPGLLAVLCDSISLDSSGRSEVANKAPSMLPRYESTTTCAKNGKLAVTCVLFRAFPRPSES